MPKSNRPHEYLTTPTGALTTPPNSPKILIHTHQGKIVGIYCDQPAKILEVETQGDLPRADHQAMPAISPQTSVKVINGRGTSVAHTLAMAVDGPSMDGIYWWRWPPMRLKGKSGLTWSEGR
jgi:hypothetical protein